MREEMLTLLRRRADGDEDEASFWYEDHERIAHRPAQWLRRHVSCVQPQDIDAAPGTCKAVTAAMRWYYAAAALGLGLRVRVRVRVGVRVRVSARPRAWAWAWARAPNPDPNSNPNQVLRGSRAGSWC